LISSFLEGILTMSANNQTLIKEYKGKWYVFTNIQAETWCNYDEEKQEIIKGTENRLSLKSARVVCDNRDEAWDKAWELDKESGEWEEGTEYGVQLNRLYKDNSEVFLEEL